MNSIIQKLVLFQNELKITFGCADGGGRPKKQNKQFLFEQNTDAGHSVKGNERAVPKLTFDGI